MGKTRPTYFIVEDDPVFVEILKMITAKVQGMELLGTSDNTLGAAKCIDLDKPDILLLDITISGLEGPEILEISEHKPKTIIISSHPETVMDNYSIDYVQYIQKPLKDSEQLINAMIRCADLL